jgi:hypothetical protein
VSEPIRHHYIPIFYLRRWTGADGLLCEYSRPYKEVKAMRKAPKRTAYVRELYTVPGVPPSLAQFVEKQFMRATDDWAARAAVILQAPHGNNPKAQINMRERAGWARFLYSLMIRNPEYMVRIEAKAAEHILASIEEVREEYDLLRKETDPPTFEEFKEKLLTDPLNTKAQALLPMLINSTNVIKAICDMRWSTVEVKDTRFPFLTSDRPIIMTNGLKVEGAHVVIPISPTRLFFAVGEGDEKTYRTIREMRPNVIVERTNNNMASQARKFVYGVDDRQLRFVAKRLGKMQRATPLETV